MKDGNPEPLVQRQDRGHIARLVLNSPDAFRTFLERESGKWAQVARRGGIEAE